MENSKRKPSAARHRVEVKLSEEQKDVITRGAALAKQGLSEFVRTAAENAARDLISRADSDGLAM